MDRKTAAVAVAGLALAAPASLAWLNPEDPYGGDAAVPAYHPDPVTGYHVRPNPVTGYHPKSA